MTLNKVLDSLEQLKTRLVSHLKLIYLKLEVGPPTSNEQVEALEATLPFDLEPDLIHVVSGGECALRVVH